MRELRSMADLNEMLEASYRVPILLFKHSTRCPVSAWASQEWARFAASPEARRVGLAMVRVIESRPVSLAVARQVGVAHESPQAILVRNGRGVWSRSHYGITAQALKAAASSA